MHKIYEKFPYKIENGVLLIPLINKQHKEPKYYAKASIEDKDKLLKYSFSAHHGRNTIYAISNKDKYKKNKMMHALVIDKIVPPKHDIDHMDHDGLNNTRENLNIVTKNANSQNTNKKDNCTSKYIGVDLKNNKWRGKIRINGNPTYLGLFENEEDSGKAYDIHAINHYGVNCKTNNLLNEDEINNIIKNGIPEGWEAKSRTKKDKDLPMYVKRVGKKFQVEYKKAKFKKNVDTLEEAIKIKDKLIANDKEKKIKKENERCKNIIRNSDGNAVIHIRNKCKKIIYEIIVDDDVWKHISSMSWSLNFNYAQTTINNSNILMHRYIYEKYVKKIPEGKSIDHIDSTRVFDNRICNLRPADASLQNHNKSKDKNSLDKYKGVYFDDCKFCVLINTKTYGTFETAEEAASKANEVFKEMFGKNAYQNKIDFSVKTSKNNRIKEEDITEEYIMKLKYIKDLRNIIMIKKLNNKANGPINTSELKRDNLDEFKIIVIQLLFKKEIEIKIKEELEEIEKEKEEIMNIKN